MSIVIWAMDEFNFGQETPGIVTREVLLTFRHSQKNARPISSPLLRRDDSDEQEITERIEA